MEEKQTGADPMELWSRWYETGSRMWSEALGGEREGYADPYGLYRQWFEGMEEARERMMGAASGGDSGARDFLNPRAFWGKWFESAADSWQKSARLGTELANMTPRWLRMLDEARENLMAVENVPGDPVEFAVQWYNATSGPYAEFVQDVIEREEFLEASSRAAQNYASLYKIFSRRSEEYLSNLQLPVRSDITRVAELIVNLEDKVDRLEEAFEDFEYGYQQPATTGGVSALEERIDRVEGKLDQLLATLEDVSANGGPRSEGQEEPQRPEIKATTAARRKAEELGVDLSEIEGTGTDGQITVSDVREKGDS